MILHKQIVEFLSCHFTFPCWMFGAIYDCEKKLTSKDPIKTPRIVLIEMFFAHKLLCLSQPSVEFNFNFFSSENSDWKWTFYYITSRYRNWSCYITGYIQSSFQLLNIPLLEMSSSLETTTLFVNKDVSNKQKSNFSLTYLNLHEFQLLCRYFFYFFSLLKLSELCLLFKYTVSIRNKFFNNNNNKTVRFCSKKFVLEEHM